MDLDEDDPAQAFTCRIVEPAEEDLPEEEEGADAGGYSVAVAPPPMVEYFDEKGNNVTPLPLHTLDEEDQELLGKDPFRRRRYPPTKNPIMRTFLHVTTALYSMAGLGSLETSKAFKAIKKEIDEEEGPEAQGEQAAKEQQQQQKRTEEATLSGRMKARRKTEARLEEADAAAAAARLKETKDEHLPDSMRAKTASEINILLVETDTIWMLELLGTCVEVDPDKKEEAKEEEKEEGKGTEAEQRAKAEMELMVEEDVAKYELVESWTQTLDFSKKKKGAQCDDIVTDDGNTQVSTKNFLDEERKQQADASSQKSPRGGGPKMAKGLPTINL